jgi:ATP-dependent Lon protease
MQESARIALSWVRGHAERLGIDPQVFAKSDLHIHVPAGAVPKDGPSAGLVMVVALVSLFRGEPVRPRVAMSGEITLSGQVLDIGGVKEKVLAAKRSGVQEIVLPEGNRDRVLEDIAPHLRAGLEFHFVRTIEAAVERAFATRQEPLTRVARPTMPS